MTETILVKVKSGKPYILLNIGIGTEVKVDGLKGTQEVVKGGIGEIRIEGELKELVKFIGELEKFCLSYPGQSREVKKTRKVRRSRKRATKAKVKKSRRSGTLRKGMSYCQYSKCPEGSQPYLRKNMTRFNDMVFCSNDCVKGFKRDNKNIEG